MTALLAGGKAGVGLLAHGQVAQVCPIAPEAGVQQRLEGQILGQALQVGPTGRQARRGCVFLASFLRAIIRLSGNIAFAGITLAAAAWSVEN